MVTCLNDGLAAASDSYGATVTHREPRRRDYLTCRGEVKAVDTSTILLITTGDSSARRHVHWCL